MGKAVIFDLDGTLIDTLKGITKALNETLKELNIPYFYNEEIVRTFIGNGARTLFFKGIKREFSEEEYSLFLKNYEKYQYISPLYNNVLNTLKLIKNKGYLLFIYSNKPNELLSLLIKEKFKEDIAIFKEIKGEDKNYPKKPDPTYLNELFNKYDIDKLNSYYIGDSITDINLSKNVSIKSIIVSYGYGNKKELKESNYLINDFKEILDIIK